MFSWVIIFLSFKIMFIFILLSNDPVQLQLLKSEIDTFSCPAAVFFFFQFWWFGIMRFLFVIRCRFRPAPEISHYLFRNQFATIETSRNLRRVNFRKDFWDCY